MSEDNNSSGTRAGLLQRAKPRLLKGCYCLLQFICCLGRWVDFFWDDGLCVACRAKLHAARHPNHSPDGQIPPQSPG